ncbi:MAG: TlpA family protein disulfide reductase [Ginsengibacter sp.]
MKTTSILLLLLMIAGFAFTACQSTTNKNAQIQPAPVEKEIGSQPAQTQDVSFLDENGQTVTLSSLRGKVVFINFWATWCPPCKVEMPGINRLKKSFKGNDKIVFLMVDVDGNLKKSSAFMKNNKYELPVYAPASAIPSNFLGMAIPTTVILNKNGEIATRVEGAADYSRPEVLKTLNELMSGS